jgi:hypothetical protein
MVAGQREGFRVETHPQMHPWLGVMARKEHAAWLGEMKGKFQREKDLLRKITRDYEGGDFI